MPISRVCPLSKRKMRETGADDPVQSHYHVPWGNSLNVAARKDNRVAPNMVWWGEGRPISARGGEGRRLAAEDETDVMGSWSVLVLVLGGDIHRQVRGVVMW